MRQIIDLSHKLFPKKEEYKLELKTCFVEEMFPQYKRRPEDWYIISEICLNSHVGTHIEAPYHYLKEGKDVSSLGFEKLIGEAIIVDMMHKNNGEEITEKDFAQYEKIIKENDFLFIKTGMSKNYRTPFQHNRPYLNKTAIEWIVNKKISCLGVDCSGIEKKGADFQENHLILLKITFHLLNI